LIQNISAFQRFRLFLSTSTISPQPQRGFSDLPTSGAHRRYPLQRCRYQFEETIQATAHFMKIKALFIKFTSRIVHCPELVSQLIGKIGERPKSLIVIFCFRD
jgi:hypothetical protein